MTAHLHRRAAFFFAGLALLTLPAFWPSYFSPPKPIVEWRVHLHGAAMFAWLALLIVQATLIRRENRAAHRATGRLSYVLVPLIVASTLSLLHLRLNQTRDAEMLYFLYVILSLTAVFTLSYALAMWNRRQPAIHARFMICTALAIVDPIVGRLVLFYGGINYPAMQAVTFILIDAILVALALADRRSAIGRNVFPAMLAVFVAIQIPTFFLYRTAWWPQFADWCASLPIP